MQLVQRLLCINNIREIGAEKISQLPKSFHCFLLMYDDGETPEIDWEFCLFSATEHQYNTLFANFTPKPKEEEAKSTLIITEDKPTLNVERPDLQL